jgi:hypothetical protein
MNIVYFLILLLAAESAVAQTSGFLGIRAKKGESLAECAVVEQLAPGGPAQRAGLLQGDSISRIDGVAVDCSKIEKGTPILGGVKPGDRVVFEVLRAGKKIEIPVVAGEVPAPLGTPREDRARLEAGREVFQRLIRNREVFTITLKDGGGFQVSGKMSLEEATQLHYYFDQKFGVAFFTQFMKTKQQDLYVYFDREKGAYQFELAVPAPPPSP